jgi:hypothetical protein
MLDRHVQHEDHVIWLGRLQPLIDRYGNLRDELVVPGRGGK